MYLFETDQIGISDIGIHLLRSRYNYETIHFEGIDEIRLSKGKQVRNWILLVLFGIALTGVGLYAGFQILYDYFFGHLLLHYRIEQFLFPLFPVLVGGYSLYTALRTGYVLEVVVDRKTTVFALEALHKQKQITALQQTLQANRLTGYKFIDLIK